MRTLIVSDLHLGLPGRLVQADEALKALLVSYIGAGIRQERWDRVVFLGDMFDLWHSEYSEIAEAHKDLLMTIDDLSAEVIYLPGNHDGEFRGMRQLNNMAVAWPPYTFEDGGRTFALTHGDEFDTFSELQSRMASWIGTVADKIACWLLGPGSSVQRAFRRSLAETPYREKYAGPIAQAAVDSLHADYVIIGHTHMPEIREYGPKTYVNTGDFGPEHLSYVTVTNGIVELHGTERI
jgi:UDP-2,3-diacylglucosamine pyrophosphatase LpxH